MPEGGKDAERLISHNGISLAVQKHLQGMILAVGNQYFSLGKGAFCDFLTGTAFEYSKFDVNIRC